MNVVLLLLLFVIRLLSIYLIYKYFGLKMLYYLLMILIIITFICSFKIVNIFGLNFNANVIGNSLLFSLIYLMLEKRKKNTNNKIIEISLFTILFSSIMVLTYTAYLPSVNDIVSVNMSDIIFDNYRILIIFTLLLIVFEFAFIKLYDYIKEEIYDNIIVLVGLLSLILGLAYYVTFNVVGYIFILRVKQIIELILTDYIMFMIFNLVSSFFVKKIISVKKVSNE